MPISHVQLLSVPVTDVDRARTFYTDVLGFAMVRDAQMPERRWVQLAPPDGQTSLTLVTWFDTMPAGSLRGLVLGTTDLDAESQRLASLGVDISEGITQSPWGRSLGIADPDGNRLVLQEYR